MSPQTLSEVGVCPRRFTAASPAPLSPSQWQRLQQKAAWGHGRMACMEVPGSSQAKRKDASSNNLCLCPLSKAPQISCCSELSSAILHAWIPLMGSRDLQQEHGGLLVPSPGLLQSSRRRRSALKGWWAARELTSFTENLCSAQFSPR